MIHSRFAYQTDPALQPSAVPLTYEPFYGLSENPFSLSPDPKFTYHSSSHDRALQELVDALGRGVRVLLLTGESGIGKTTVCRSLVRQLGRRTVTSFIADPVHSLDDVLKTVLVDFGVSSREDAARGRLAAATRQELTVAVGDFAASLAPLQASAVIIVDEAQNVPPDILDAIVALSEPVSTDRRVQIILAGQRWEILRPAVAGEEICEVFTTRSITEKQGRTGPMVFVEKEAVVTTRDGEVIQRYGNSLILRDPPPPLPPYAGEARSYGHPEGSAATEWDGEALIKRPDMISLFLFDGAAWCVHRIHWDIPYAQQEGLPAPILPGWMTSSYLAQLAQARAPEGQRLHKLDVRYKASVFPGDTVRCTGARGEEGMALSAVNQNGVENASATASFLPL